MTRKTPSLPRLSAHFVGVGGIGISALARWFLAQNWAVTGSDLADSQILVSLRRAGVKVKIGHKSTNLSLKGPSMVIYSSAVPHSNQELVEARRRGIIPLSYSEAVGCLTKIYKTIAIAGSHGKSTTTALASLVLLKSGLDPNVILGTNLKEFGNTNFRMGKSKWLVLEADEWNASFLNYYPEISIVTNIDKEHLDFYKNFANVKKTFLKFLGNTKKGGILILNREDKNLYSLRSPIALIAKKKNLKVVWYSANRNNELGIRNQELRNILKIPGAHNISNAAAVLKLAEVLKIKKSVALKAISAFRGSWRRFEFKGNAKFIIHNSKFIIPVYDDYAHHPTEIKATLQGFREKFPESRIICVFQPHQARRLKALFQEFVSAFELADVLVLLPVYEVAGRDKVNSSYSSKKLADAIRWKYRKKKIYYLENPRRIKKFLTSVLNKSASSPRKSAVVVMMGAGTVVEYTPLLLTSK